MAVFESLGKIRLKPILSNTDDVIDLRTVKLPLVRPSSEDNFDPRKHRKPEVAIKPWMAYINLMRGAVGIGMLGAPLATSKAGLLIGPILSLFIGSLLIHTHLMLLSCLNEICRQLKIPYVSYRCGVRLALLHGPPLFHNLGNWGPYTIALFMFLSHLGICSVRIVFIADNLRDMLDWTDSSISILYVIIPALILEILMKNLRIISYIINGANVVNLVGLILVIVQIYRGPRRETQLFPQGWVAVLLAIGTYMFTFSAVGVILSCEKALENPYIMSSRFGVVRVGILLITMVNILIGTLGFWSYGAMDENILRHLAYDDPVTMAAFGLFSASCLLSYPIACYPGYQIVLEVIKYHDPNVTFQRKSLKKIELFSRPIFVLMSFAIAYYKPYQGPLVAFVGCICTTLLSLVFPALMEIGLCYPDYYGRYHYILLKDLLIVVMGLIIWVGGLILWIYLLYIHYQSPHAIED